MATINLGSIKFKWQGAYAGGTAYTVDDVVSYNGSSYICILASTGNLPTNATYWEQMSQKGTDGTNGTDGTDLTTTLTTQGDILYRDGSGLQKLGAGTSGQFLKTQGTGANPVWGTVSSALLNVYQFLRDDAFNVTTNGSPNRIITSSTITPVSTNSVFYATGHVVAGTGNDGATSLFQYSTNNGSSWSTGQIADSRSSNMRGHGGNFIKSDQDNHVSSVVLDYFAPSIATANFKVSLCVQGHSGGNIYVNYFPSELTDGNKSVAVSSFRLYEFESSATNGNIDVSS
jgi:hypothetical protein